MVKVRMNTADVAAEVKCLRKLIGMRLSNVYDLSPKTYVFKLMNSSGETESGESEKVLLLMESGVRLHTTVYMRDKSNTPSGFTLKIRKHIRTRRLEDVRQLGYDRIILFQFGLGVNAHYVILELYAQGNIILTDPDFTVLTLLRSHRDDDKGFAIMSRHRYPIEVCRTFERTTTEKLQANFISYVNPDKDLCQENNGLDDNSSGAHKGKQEKQKGTIPVESNTNAKDGGRTKQATLKVVLGEVLGYGPALSEHILIDAGLIPNTKVGKDFKLDDGTLAGLSEAVTRFENWLEDIISGGKIPEGYILLQKSSGRNDTANLETSHHGQIYDEYCPLLLNQFKSRDSMKFETFDAALDEYYSKIESQRSEQQQKSKESNAMQKLNKIKVDQENRVHTLKREVEHCVTMAELIEYNLEDVDAAILAVRVALANGMSWDDLARMVKEEKKSGNPVAGLIDKLNLERNCITLLLSNNLDEMDDDEKTQPVDKVEVDLALSAHANARRWYGMKKKQESKQEKTVTAHEKAFKAAEKKTRLQLSQEKVVAAISHMRRVHWFEKFNWFISSENYLVISGRDAQQNEMIVKRYMSKGDLYVHAELHGASSTVIKNHKPDSHVPPLTVTQAGCFTVCHSKAWDSKIVTSAWWVYPDQVSKTAPTGEYLTVGSFMIRGKKNFLPPHPLIMGFGLLFRLDESSLGAHLNERRVRGEEEAEITEDKEQQELHHEVSDAESEEVSEVNRGGEPQSIIQDLAPNISGPEFFSSDLEAHNDLKTSANSNSISGTVGSTTHSNRTNENDASSKTDTSTITPQLEDLLDKALELGSAPVSAKNYGIQSSQVSLEHEEGAKKGTQREKPYVSKAERRKLKKGQNDSAEDSNVEQRNKGLAASHDSANKYEKTVHDLKLQGGKTSRGQKGKLKKIKEKYADQDEEERRIRMALLAPAGKAQKKEKAFNDEKAIDVAIDKPAVAPEDAPKICYKCKKVGHLSRDCHEHLNEALKTNSTSDHVDKVEMEEDDINEIGEEEKEKLQDVDYLTGSPLPNDILMYAVPVCGPYNALQSYKYRVKLIPGTLKKGKAAKTSMNLFSHMPEATVREKELMKACTDPELVAAMVGNVKVTAAGLSQLKQNQKKSKKSKKGEK